jgi:hypothetical protein
MSLTELHLAEIQSLKDIEDIRRLKHDYCFHGDVWPDKPNDPDKQAALFADDGVWDLMPSLRSVGPRAIAAGLKKMTGHFSTALHIVTSGRIDVNGDTATGTWYLLLPCAAAGPLPPQPEWTTTQYTEECVRTPKGWRIKYMTSKKQFVAPFLISTPAAEKRSPASATGV